MADQKKGLGERFLDAVNKNKIDSPEAFEQLLSGTPHGYDVASKITDNPYLGTALASGIDLAPMALGMVTGHSPGMMAGVEEAAAKPYRIKVSDGEIALKHPHVKGSGLLMDPESLHEHRLDMSPEETGLNYENPFYLESLEVHPDHQGSGLGSKALMALENKAKALGSDGVVLNASPQGAFNSVRDGSMLPDLVKFYEKNGYNAIKDEGSNVLMHKALTPVDAAAAHPVLSKITSAEQAAALHPEARAEYLKALDDVYGPRDQRAKQMGFGKQTWYHGTGSDFNSFDPALGRTNAGGPTGKYGPHFSKDPALANQYAAEVTPAWYKKIFAESNKNIQNISDAVESMQTKYGPKWREYANPDELERVASLKKTFHEFQPNLTAAEEKLKLLPEGIEKESGNNVIPVRLKTKNMVAQELDGGSVGYDEAAFTKSMKDEGKHNGVVFKNAWDNLNHVAYEDPASVVKSTDVAVAFNPNEIRSVNAAFDPRFSDSSNLLAGKLGTGAPVTNQSNDDEQHFANGGTAIPSSLAANPEEAPAPVIAAAQPAQAAPAPQAPSHESVNMIDPGTGEIGSVPTQFAHRYLNQGYQLATPEETDSYIKEQKYGGVGQQAITGLEGAAKAATFGASSGIERAIGVPKEDITGREETNPVSSFLGQGAGLIGSSFIPGVGAANIMEHAGQAGAAALGMEGTSALAKIGSAAVKGAIENGIYQSGDEVSKMLLSDPNQSVQTAIANVGLGSVLGAGISGGIGVVSPLWKASTGEKFGQWLEAVQRRANGEAVALPEELQSAMDRLGIDKSSIPPEVMAGMAGSDNVRQQFQILQESQTPAGLKLQETLKAFKSKIGEIQDVTKDDVKSFVGDVQANLREGSYAEAVKAREELENLRDQVRNQNLEDKTKSDQMLNSIKTGIDAAKIRAQQAGDEEIVKAFGFDPLTLKGLGEISIKNAGAHAEESLTQELRAIVEPAQQKYEALAKPLQKAALNSTDDVLADELAHMAEAKGLTFMSDSPQNKLVQRAMQGLTEARSVEQLMKLQSDIGAAGRNDLSLIHASKSINEVIQNGIERVLDRELGKRGPEVFQQWMGAKAAWRDVRGVLDELGQRLKPGKYSGPETFIGALKSKKRDEAILAALTKDKDADLLKLLESRFPQTSEKVKAHALEELLGEAKLKAKDGRLINSDWLMSHLDQLTPEYREWLLKTADEASARNAHKTLDLKLQALESEGSATLDKTAHELEKSKIKTKAEQDAKLNDLRDAQQKRLFEMKEAARTEIEAKKGSAAQKLEDIRLINSKMFHKSSNTAGNLDALWSNLPGGAMALASMLVGHNPAIGWMIGQTGKWVMRDAPDALRLAFLKFLGHEGPVEPEAFKSMVDFIHSTIKGQNQVIRASKAVLDAGQIVVPASMVPKEKDRHRLEKSLQKLQQDPSPLMDTGGKTSHYMPEHGAALGQTAATAVNYLNTLRPNVDKRSPLDAKVPVSPIAKAAYDRALDIAEQPLMVLQSIKEGTLVPQDITHLQSLYPELASKFKQQLMNEVIAKTHKEEIIPYETRMSLSLFLGQALDSTLTPMALNLTQPMRQATAPQANGQAGMKQKHSMAAIGKMSKEDQTPGQAREAQKLQA